MEFFLEPEQEGRVTRQAMKLGDHQGGVVEAAQGQRIRELRAVDALAALDLDKLGDEGPAVEEAPSTAARYSPRAQTSNAGVLPFIPLFRAPATKARPI